MDRLRLILLSSALGLGACSNETSTPPGIPPTTAVAVDPAQFLGDVKCGDEPGDMRLFVATLFDVSPQGELGIGSSSSAGCPEEGKQCLVLPSSDPTSCHVDVLFVGVIDGREYEVEVDGYDRDDASKDPTNGITFLAKGNRAMVVKSTGAYAPPRWTTRCAHNRLPPSLRRSNGGLLSDAGAIEYADSGYQADGGYAECRPVVLYGPNRSPWLEGPVCAANLATITARGCDALTLVP
jgi:hypothetical protein